jgi:transcriptional regulator with XRE-family HTH domain
MLHEQIREARIKAGLTQVKLAKLAGVPRSQLRKFEEGGNITLSTLRKIVAQLPGLQTLNLGAVEIQPGGVDQDMVRQTAIQLILIGQQLLKSVGTWAGTSATTAPEPAAAEEPFIVEEVKPEPDRHVDEPVGATRFVRKHGLTPEMREKLLRLEAVIAQKKSEPEREH